MLKKGFTLIELLVVIAIISIITSIGVTNFITAQKQARDAARREIISNVQSAFEQYYAANGVYPPAGSEALAFEGGTAPTDPKNAAPYVLSWNVADYEYCICATLENGDGNAAAPSTSSTKCTWTPIANYYCAMNKQ